MTNKQFDKAVGFFVREVIRSNDNLHDFQFDYKAGKGHFKINTEVLISCFNQTEFKKVVSMMESNDNPQVIAGYLNSIIKRIYNNIKDVNLSYELKHGKSDDNLIGAMEYLEKRNDILVKALGVAPVNEVVNDFQTIPDAFEPEQDLEQETNLANEIMTELKRCNVNRLIPTQVKPVWENCKVETKIGYMFEYRGMPLQVVTDKGWVKQDYTCTIFIIDPVIGLPITSYEGTLNDLDSKLSEVFINYLKTIENNKEFIVQVATAFNRLTSKTKIA